MHLVKILAHTHTLIAGMVNITEGVAAVRGDRAKGFREVRCRIRRRSEGMERIKWETLPRGGVSPGNIESPATICTYTDEELYPLEAHEQ